MRARRLFYLLLREVGIGLALVLLMVAFAILAPRFASMANLSNILTQISINTVIAVGMIQGADHANTIVAAGRADLVALARAHLSDPYLTHRHAQAEGVDSIPWPSPYGLVKPHRRKR